MRELLDTLEAWHGEGIGFGRAVLIRTFGSAPRREGATLLVAEDGRLAGSVSGGCVEAACAEEVMDARRTGISRVVRYGITDEQAWDVGLACGSTIDVLIEPELRPEVASAARDGLGTAVVIPLPDGAPGPLDGRHEPASGPFGPALVVRMDEPPVAAVDGAEVASDLVAAASDLVAAARAALDAGRSLTLALDGTQYFLEAFPVAPRLIVFGAVQSAVPLVRFARELGFHTIVTDARAAFVTAERFPEADELVCAWPEDVARQVSLGPRDSVVVMTHDPKLDEPAIVAATHAACAYVGAIGSRRTQAARRTRLMAAGMTADDLARLRAPIGLDLGGRDPAETALSILAEVVAVRHGRSGGPLRMQEAVAVTPIEAAGVT